MELHELLAQAQDWLAQDPDQNTRLQLQTLIASAKTDPIACAELRDSFSADLQFGTAGLRGKLGPGPNRMNRVTVMRAAAGLGQFLINQGENGKSIVIGYDGRHNSDVFAIDSAKVLVGMNFKVQVFSSVIPTPVLAFSVRELMASAGIMVTASHNPAQDNGYKVYLGDGRQIVSPTDKLIAEQISAVSDVRNLKLIDGFSFVSDEVLDKYVQRTSAIITDGPVPRADIESIHCVYTAMHGVGWRTFVDVLTEAGFSLPISVQAQQDPNPDFPTVDFPNPEEPGALDLALDLAGASSAEVIVANDPDADRLAIVIPNSAGKWVQLRGDQVGVLLGWWIIKRNSLLGRKLEGTFANSIVSSTQLAAIAKSAHINFSATLTGFKWVSRVPNLIYGYEEALGYCVDPSAVGDKDGISAAVMFLELIAYLKGNEQSIWEVLDEIAHNHGLHDTDQISIRVTEISNVTAVMTKLRELQPTKIGGFIIAKFEDLVLGEHLPATDGLIFELAPTGDISWARIIIRPSGTEPKIKCYLEVACVNSNLTFARATNQKALSELAKSVRPLLTGD